MSIGIFRFFENISLFLSKSLQFAQNLYRSHISFYFLKTKNNAVTNIVTALFIVVIVKHFVNQFIILRTVSELCFNYRS